jgi:hypothetical protein
MVEGNDRVWNAVDYRQVRAALDAGADLHRTDLQLCA